MIIKERYLFYTEELICAGTARQQKRAALRQTGAASGPERRIPMNYYSDRPYNYTMLTDFYELTMANGYFELGKKDEIAYFDMFFRRVPDGGGYAITAGLEQVGDYLQNLKFT